MSRRLSLYLKSVKAIWNARHCDKRLVIWVRNIHLSRMLNSKSISMLHLLFVICFCLFTVYSFRCRKPVPSLTKSFVWVCTSYIHSVKGWLLVTDSSTAFPTQAGGTAHLWNILLVVHCGWLIHLWHIFLPRSTLDDVPSIAHLTRGTLRMTFRLWRILLEVHCRWLLQLWHILPVVHRGWLFHLWPAWHILPWVHCGWFFSIYGTSYPGYTVDDSFPFMAHLTRGILWMTVPSMAHLTQLHRRWLFHIRHIFPGVYCWWFRSINGTSQLATLLLTRFEPLS